ncbi:MULTISPECIES: aminotransferase [unclassified Paracoccus (in: a-proteobacteria)]|uniref:aminotransferase n=1 Tax=unclassified Paracoccus (in: a-proteobacteria) TaxID=2688777 RepID=UPI0012B20685|nr:MULTISPECIES: aminotransferase [unclassified Paracoccus (in: a-proteobacteria)]UXU73654.1 aminotransferase [Paracoccus sp. SMMA_5]UXU79543.1 aminotransferase [Paracoccus sp. SMMA_5_TC]
MMPVNPALHSTFAPPVMQARRWLEGVEFPSDRPLINVSQAAPVAPPPLALREAIARAALEQPEAHLYGPVLGRRDLREAVARRWSAAYGGGIAADQVAITQGCNQAFCAAIQSLAASGDEVILPVPWYFNHKMWLDMQGIGAIGLHCGPDMVPDPQRAAALIGPRTRAIALVSPNNPTGAEYPAWVLRGFHDLCRAHGLALVLDETYRDFDSRPEPVHDLFTRPDWTDTLIHLYSFSKAYRLTGHRVGAIIAGRERLAQIEKFLDTVAICANQLGQIAAGWGMAHLDDWLAAERAEILARAGTMRQGMASLPGWRVRGCGAYFLWAEHPWDVDSADLAPRLVREAGVLLLPGDMFMPAGDPQAARSLRIAFANIDRAGIAELLRRLADFRP